MCGNIRLSLSNILCGRSSSNHLLKCSKEVFLVVEDVGAGEDGGAGHTDHVVDVHKLGGDVGEGQEAEHDLLPWGRRSVEAGRPDDPQGHLGAPGEVVVGQHHTLVAGGVDQTAALVNGHLGEALIQPVGLQGPAQLKQPVPGQDVLLVALGQAPLVRQGGLALPLHDALQTRKLVLDQENLQHQLQLMHILLVYLLEQGLMLHHYHICLAVDTDPGNLLGAQSCTYACSASPAQGKYRAKVGLGTREYYKVSIELRRGLVVQVTTG